MTYLLRTNTIYQYLKKKFERAVSMHVWRDGLEMPVCLRSFFVRKRLLPSENGLYEIANAFCHVGPNP